ncbi:MAG: hypothetical protein L0Z68_06880 [Gammaproteobacteria bacterium]|nr:hypothetical protein [Gammaproteobacteria bacterium]
MSNKLGGRVVYIVPRTWLGRLVAFVAIVAVFFLGILFFAVFLAAIAAVAAVVIARILWLQRQIRRQGSKDFIEVEYTVEDTETRRPGEIAQSDSQRAKDHENEANH